MTKDERRVLSRYQCAWCDQRLSANDCGAIYEGCTAEQREQRRQKCLAALRSTQRRRGK